MAQKRTECSIDHYTDHHTEWSGGTCLWCVEARRHTPHGWHLQHSIGRWILDTCVVMRLVACNTLHSTLLCPPTTPAYMWAQQVTAIDPIAGRMPTLSLAMTVAHRPCPAVHLTVHPPLMPSPSTQPPLGWSKLCGWWLKQNHCQLPPSHITGPHHWPSLGHELLLLLLLLPSAALSVA